MPALLLDPRAFGSRLARGARDGEDACGTAVQRGARVVVGDVTTDRELHLLDVLVRQARGLGSRCESGRAAFLFEANDGLTAGDGDFTVDYRALRDGDAPGDDVSLDDGGRAYF